MVLRQILVLLLVLATSCSSSSALFGSSTSPPSVTTPDLSSVFSTLSPSLLRNFQSSPLHFPSLLPSPSSLFNLSTLDSLVGTHVSGHTTSRTNGTWLPSPLNPNQLSGLPLQSSHITSALKRNSTISFNTASSLFPSISSLSLSSLSELRYPCNVNVYISPVNDGEESVVPVHTDRQDVLIFQTEGIKKWTVYPRPLIPRTSNNKIKLNPLSRGKAGDVISPLELTSPTSYTLKPGDVLYVPLGFPHHTSTVSRTESIHLTLGLDTVVWGLTLMHLRWACMSFSGLKYDVDMGGVGDEGYWKCMKGIMFEGEEREEDVEKFMRELEPERKDFPSRKEIKEVIRIFQKHKEKIIEVQAKMYTNVNPHDPENIVKAVRGGRDLDMCMAELGTAVKCKAFYEEYMKKVEVADGQLEKMK
ncbi:hypothetical protein TrLO_g4561 [Triparma laevis f. longispina]|uniref:Bifunctional lysine-specific demethylase and histidyl-hydroxylase n=1 Tax=Triparma laevis f. longispina TaxID=1714387 RepID=A0A9W6Z5I2_9STRA|nr:hypothetical protein TrLO_g4561 [Triparma laevis f. longispina]